jgi:hypothetical protein
MNLNLESRLWLCTFKSIYEYMALSNDIPHIYEKFVAAPRGTHEEHLKAFYHRSKSRFARHVRAIMIA